MAFYSTYGFTALEIEDIKEEWFQYLYKIIRFCKKNGVELTLVCAPLSEHLLIAYGNYDEYYKLVAEIASEENVEFWDFNLCREEYLSSRAEYYQDEAHLNMYGAEKFSELMADLIAGKVDYDDICYESVKDRLGASEPGLCGVVHELENMRIIAKDSDLFEYEIRAVPDGGEEYLIQNFSFETEFSVNAGEHGVLSMIARKRDDWEEITEVEIHY